MIGEKISIKQVVIYAGAFIAFLIGSGFATGQEILQYFAAYGYWGIAGAIVVFVLFLYVGISFISVGHKYKYTQGKDVYNYYCGKYIGIFFDYFSIAFIYMSFVVMISGAGATLNQQYTLPPIVGGVTMAIIAGFTVMFGLGKIVDVIGKIGPIIVIMAICLGLSAIILNPSGLTTATEAIPKLNLLKASSNWIFAAGSYVGFCMLWLVAFLSAIGAEAKSKREAIVGISAGAVAFSVSIIIMSLGLMANIEQVAGSLIPTLILAGNIHPTVAIIFSVTVVAGIYTTACPLLWTVVSKIEKDDKSNKFKIVTVILAVLGIMVSFLVSFDKLVNVIYVINGYAGFVLLIFMLVKDYRVKKSN